MTHTLLMRLSGPMQSWGTRSRFGERDTEREPTKSGVIGIVCAALGRPRDAPLDDLAALRFGVRVDREGKLERDFQTALDVRKADPTSASGTVTSNRYYLADAVFLGAFEGELEVLEKIDQALAAPVWPLFLGRKAFVPSQSVRLRDGLQREKALEAALAAYPLLVASDAPRHGTGPEAKELRVQLECRPGQEGEPRQDVPLSFESNARRFAVRTVRFDHVPRPSVVLCEEGPPCT